MDLGQNILPLLAGFVKGKSENKRNQAEMERYKLDAAMKKQEMALRQKQIEFQTQQHQSSMGERAQQMQIAGGILQSLGGKAGLNIGQMGGGPAQPAPAQAGPKFAPSFDRVTGASGGDLISELAGQGLPQALAPQLSGGGLDFSKLSSSEAAQLQWALKTYGVDLEAMKAQQTAFEQNQTKRQVVGDVVYTIVGNKLISVEPLQKVRESLDPVTGVGTSKLMSTGDAVTSSLPTMQFEKTTDATGAQHLYTINPKAQNAQARPVTGPDGKPLLVAAPPPKPPQTAITIGMTQAAIAASDRMLEFLPSRAGQAVVSVGNLKDQWDKMMSPGSEVSTAFKDYTSTMEVYARSNSGAAITKDEWPNFERQIKPLWNDSTEEKILKVAKGRAILDASLSYMDPSQTDASTRHDFAMMVANAKSYDEINQIVGTVTGGAGGTGGATGGAGQPAVKEYILQ